MTLVFDNIDKLTTLLTLCINDMVNVKTLTLIDTFLGWIGILAKWSKNQDMRIKVTASKCLSNLDTDDPRSFTYPAKVYPLHPLHRMRHNPDLDIVFIHGILGN